MNQPDTDWWELTLPYLARVALFALVVFVIAQCGCAGTEPSRIGRNAGCDLVAALDPYGLPGWTALECAHPFAVAQWHGPKQACGFERPGKDSRFYGPGALPCGFVDAYTDCAHKEIKVWWYAVNSEASLRHELEHARKDCK